MVGSAPVSLVVPQRYSTEAELLPGIWTDATQAGVRLWLEVGGDLEGIAARARAWEGQEGAGLARLVEVIGPEAGQLLLVEEAKGQLGLPERLARGRLTRSELVDLFSPLLEGLGAAHEAGVVHGGIHPGVMWVTEADRPELWLGGFGLPAPEGARIAPELAYGSPTAASDVYALAAVMYRATLGRPPPQTVEAGALRSALSAGLSEGLAQALDPDPKARPKLGALVERMRAPDTPPADQPSPVEAQRPPVAWGRLLKLGLGGAVAVGLVVGLGAWMERQSGPAAAVWVPKGRAATPVKIPVVPAPGVEAPAAPAPIDPAQLRELDPLDPKPTAERHPRRVTLRHRGDPGDAPVVAGGREDLEAQLKAHPERVALWLRLAREQQDNGDPDGALDVLDRALRRNPQGADLHGAKAQLLLQLGRPREAERAAGRAVRAAPARGTYRRLQGEAALARGAPRRALGAFQRATKLSPEDAAAWAGRGLAELRLRARGAAQSLDRALQLDPELLAARFGRGQLRRARGDHAGAVEDLSAVIEGQRPPMEAYYERGLAYRSLRQRSAALKDLLHYRAWPEAKHRRQLSRLVAELSFH